MYSLLRPLLFRLDAERSHDLVMGISGVVGRNKILRAVSNSIYANRVPSLPVTLAGIELPNPVGLAAGLDKHASATAGMLSLGFGFVELGTVTPQPQIGNDKPRMFRLIEHEALINRMGFNSEGFSRFRENLARQRDTGLDSSIIGINIGKNAATPIDRAVDDYLPGLQFAWSLGNYVTVNISSPNTANLRELQKGDEMSRLLESLAQTRQKLIASSGVDKPVFVKIAPDAMDPEVANHIVEQAISTGINGLIATNTTVSRPGVSHERDSSQAGGLSGAPLAPTASQVLRDITQAANGRLSVVAAGGIDSAEVAWDRMKSGAEAVQIYTGLIYKGPGLIKQIVTGLEQRMRAVHSTTLPDALTKTQQP